MIYLWSLKHLRTQIDYIHTFSEHIPVFYWLELNGVEATRPAGAIETFLHIFGVFVTKCVYLRPNEYIDVQWGWFSGGYKGFTDCRTVRVVGARKWSVWSNLSIISVIEASKLHISDIFMSKCVYLCPNVYILAQMCIFMANLTRFPDIEGVFGLRRTRMHSVHRSHCTLQ